MAIGKPTHHLFLPTIWKSPARAGSKVYSGTYTVLFVGVKTTIKFKMFHCMSFGTTLAKVASESIFGIGLR
jgi:hypothetical protein